MKTMLAQWDRMEMEHRVLYRVIKDVAGGSVKQLVLPGELK